MKFNKESVVFSVVVALLMVLSAAAQAKFTDPNVAYEFELPNDEWKLTVKPSATSPNVEYVHGGYRAEGHLEIRRIQVTTGTVLAEVVKAEGVKLQFRKGYVAGKEENFLGLLRGTVFNFEYAQEGKAMAGRFYFLRANDTTVYVLRFEGLDFKLRGITNQADSIARTFSVKH
jgi:hypothetical protein